jgi:hypothetical protein
MGTLEEHPTLAKHVRELLWTILDILPFIEED